MNIKHLIELYEEKKKIHGVNAYKHISELFTEAKEIHYKDWLKNPTKKKDHEQSWRAFKGKNYEKIIHHILIREVEDLGLKIVNGATLERKRSENLSFEESKVKRNVQVDYGDFGSHLPDVDLIIYDPGSFDIVAVISGKITLRERIAQTGYWKIKLSEDDVTKHIKVFFVTTDEDRTLAVKKPAKKGRAIVEVDTDGAYVMSQVSIEESEKVKTFDKFIEDLKLLIARKKSRKL